MIESTTTTTTPPVGPATETLSERQLGELLEVTRHRVRVLLAAGCPRDPAGAKTWVEGHPELMVRGGGGELTEARLAKLEVETDLLRERLLVLRQERLDRERRAREVGVLFPDLTPVQIVAGDVVKPPAP